MKRFLIITTFAATLSGCSSMGTPASSLIKLARLSPLESNPATIRLAVRAPRQVSFRDGDIKLVMAFDGGTTATQLREELLADLDRTRLGTPGIDTTGIGGDTFVVARLTTEDAARMRALQNQIKAIRATGIKGQGSLSLSATACRTGDSLPESIPITAWLQTEPSQDFFVFVRELDLAEQFSQSSSPVPPCDKPARD